MSYDWHGSSAVEPSTAAWLEDQDRRFLDAARFYATDRQAFDRFIPYSLLCGKDVLEIGTGSGLHAELMARAGANVTGIDLTRAAIERTQRRFELRGLRGRFIQWDAEHSRQEFGRAFDFIWSWGVIHHSSRTALIVRNVHHWVREDGTFAGMVYHRDSINGAALLLLDLILKRNMFSHTADEALWRMTDGYMARFYPADQWKDLLLGFFREASTTIAGQKTEALPLPRRLRQALLPLISDNLARRVLSRFGSFLTFRAGFPRGD